MADEADIASEVIELEDSLTVKSISIQASKIPVGIAGGCFYCGEEFPRVVEVVDPDSEEYVCACARCRDKRKL